MNIRNILPLVLLLVIGLVVHYPSFSFSLYGDDWIDVFQYRTHIDPYAHFSSLPGPLAYLAPYGFTIFLIGSLFKIFGTYYEPYFIISFLFRFIASIGFYFVCLEIGKLISKEKTSNIRFLSFLSTTLFLVGYTGIQTTDWAHYMNIYLATGLFLFSVVFQLRFYQTLKLKQLFFSLTLLIISLIVGSLRLYPVLILVPLMDVSVHLLNRKRPHSIRIVYKLFLFLAFAVILWGVGLFGSPFSFYSYGGWSTTQFLNVVAQDFLLALKSYLYLVGTLLIPNRFNLQPEVSILMGIVFLAAFIAVFVKSISSLKKNVWPVMFGIGSYFFVFTIWYFGPTSYISSEHRYLFVIFTFFVLWLHSLILFVTRKFKSSEYLIFGTVCLLIVLHVISTRQFYLHLLGKGRDFRFAKQIEETIIHDLPDQPRSTPYVYFDVDDGEVKQSLLFGLAIKTLSLKQIWDTKFIFQQYDDIKAFKKDLQKRIDKGESKEAILDSVYAFQIRDRKITNVTDKTKEQLF